MSKSAARVHIIFAREASTAVVIRRGPSRRTATLGWNRDDDTFTPGQWLKGQIFGQHCDLSPDGRHFIYFAYSGKSRPGVGDSWTAISRTPYLKALGFWPNGHVRYGGGLFVSNERFWHQRAPYVPVSDLDRCPPGMEETAIRTFTTHRHSAYHQRLERDGWKWLRTEGDAEVFEKPLPSGWVLEKSAYFTFQRPPGQPTEFDTHRLLHPRDGRVLDLPDWEWADLDCQRLVWAEHGRLFTAGFTLKGLASPELLRDFNDMPFRAVVAPY